MGSKLHQARKAIELWSQWSKTFKKNSKTSASKSRHYVAHSKTKEKQNKANRSTMQSNWPNTHNVTFRASKKETRSYSSSRPSSKRRLRKKMLITGHSSPLLKRSTTISLIRSGIVINNCKNTYRKKMNKSTTKQCRSRSYQNSIKSLPIK